MKAMQISEPGAGFELVERDRPEAAAGEVLIRVEACGICHSDAFIKDGLFPGISYPRVPGHEVIGVVEAVGDGVQLCEAGQRVGVGWHGGHCFRCDPCRTGDFINCANGVITGIHVDGGYAEYMVAREEALALVPDELSATEAAPLLCAGITTYNALRNSGALGGDVVAIQGIGGLGHLAVQYANRLGFHTVALSRGADKAELAHRLGADLYIDTDTTNPVNALQALGGARVILATAPSSAAMSSVINGLSVDGRMIVVGASADNIDVSPLQLITGRRGVTGWPSGTGKDSEETLEFSKLRDIKPMIVTYPLAEAAAAYDKMMSNEARFRVVLDLT